MVDRLVKYCRQGHNVALGAATLQLGTFAYYREMDPSFTIADPGEATHTVEFQEGLQLKVNAALSDRLFGGSIGSSDGNLTVAARRGASFRVLAANAYIFCTSRATDEQPPTIDVATKFDPAYDSVWEIADSRAFRDAVGAAILDSLTLDHLATDARARVCSLPIRDLSLQVYMLDRPVDYVEARPYRVSKDEATAHVPDYREATAQAMFRKEKRDELQREHRFVFLVTHPRLGVLDVRTGPLRIPLNRLHNTVSNIAL